MTKVVYNACYGGFGLSPEATLWLWEQGCTGVDVTHVNDYWPLADRAEGELKFPTLGYAYTLAAWRAYKNGENAGSLFLSVFTPDEQYVLNARDVSRTDPLLVQVVEDMGGRASGSCAQLAIREIPEGSKYRIDEYDGIESVVTPEEYDWQIA